MVVLYNFFVFTRILPTSYDVYEFDIETEREAEYVKPLAEAGPWSWQLSPVTSGDFWVQDNIEKLPEKQIFGCRSFSQMFFQQF